LLKISDNPFTEFVSTARKWTVPVTRKAPAWFENLADVTRWS
jgi:hypothetical protein